mgnify:CR=1 FL=1
MDLDKKAYQKKYNKEYYLKKKFSKEDGNKYFTKGSYGSLNYKRNNIEKALKENEDKANTFRELLKSQSIINESHYDKAE